MMRTAVTSKMVKALGWEDNVLEVEFHSNAEPRVYRYSPVTQAQRDEFFAEGASIGFLVNKLKRAPGVSCEHVDPAEVECPDGLVFATEAF